MRPIRVRRRVITENANGIETQIANALSLVETETGETVLSVSVTALASNRYDVFLVTRNPTPEAPTLKPRVVVQ